MIRKRTLWALLALPMIVHAGCGEETTSDDDSTGQTSAGFCADTCLKSCGNDNDCDVADGELCCDFGDEGSVCMPAAACPRFCSQDTQCDTETGEACIQASVEAPDARVCGAAAAALPVCSDDGDCGLGEKCCGIYDQPICLPADRCPKTCASSAECQSGAGEICCTSLAKVDPALEAEGLCLHPSLEACPELCSASSDCNTQRGEICCEGVCSTSCARACDESNDCPGQLCCKSKAARSPFVRQGRVPGYDVLPPQVGVGGSGGSGGFGATGGTSGSGTGGFGATGGSGGTGGTGATGGSGGTTGDTCGDGYYVIGEFATHCGLVNVHTNDLGEWETDVDCSSGCNINSLSYCQKFWPEAASLVQRSSSTSELKTFWDAGCNLDYELYGEYQYLCCAPD
jgi:hypothetical protein